VFFKKNLLYQLFILDYSRFFFVFQGVLGFFVFWIFENFIDFSYYSY